jgi:murein DD-endopeptidase MepM/ murein hydrolase activator NlpD
MSTVNKEARQERHKKLWEGHYHSTIGRVWFSTKRAIRKAWDFISPSGKRLSQFMHPLDRLPAPRRLYTQLATWSVGLLLLTSVNTTNGQFAGGEGAGQEYLSLNPTEQVTDEEGYLIKNMPLAGQATFDQNRTEMADHVVQEGETLSMIAYRYGLSVNSILYANSGLSSDYLKIGQTLKIPPKDGVYVTIPKGATLVSLMDKYKGNLDKTKDFNGVTDDSDLKEGESFFIVDGKPEVTYIASNSNKNYNTGSGFNTTGGYSASGPDVGAIISAPNALGWIRPTSGSITQGYHSGHYAYDIADRSKPDIVAVAAGTVDKTGTGWSGGYGNNVWIDHGNGYRTHYAHMSEFYVQEGDYVSQGQVIGKMGNTGRVYGVTGIHLHFEVEYNGAKISPSFMGVW